MNSVKALCLGWILLFGLMIHIKAQTSTTIVEIQSVDPNGTTDASPFLNQFVSVTGVVTASAEAGNLDAIFIQQQGQTEWAGIQLRGGSGIISLKVGDLVTVSGTVKEENGVTLLDNADTLMLNGTGNITALALGPNTFTNYSLATTEKYESMLIELKSNTGPISVVNVNPDSPNNFGEWVVGSDSNIQAEGCRILTGVQTSSAFSSLHVSYVNDSLWADNAGRMKVPAIAVKQGDKFEAIRGIMYYGSGEMKLLPRNNEDFDALAVGIEDEFPFVKEASLFPNPVIEGAVLLLELNKKENIEAAVFDMNGRLVKKVIGKTVFSTGRHKIPFIIPPNMPRGIYYLQIQSGQEVKSLKISKR
ncbi:MAG: T9SS type A sorting domain-containing protein [Bacteroidia bacterium]|nr:T9SS type A sorting domain-containing protein [Bacteroidia bacterium]